MAPTERGCGLRLAHLNLPARDPERMAAWYAEQFGFERRGAFVLGPGTLIAFEPGEPLGARGNTHFGFQAEDPAIVQRWAEHFGVTVESEPGYCAMKARDPEGNCFEIYWEPGGPMAGAM